MNCKQGDLAIIVKSMAGNEGKIVRCLEYFGIYSWTDGSFDTWIIDIELIGADGDIDNMISDHQLRPIRDSDKQDEMLSIVNLKEKVKS